ncbi:MAG: hypothetical protein CMJ41_10510 [Phycisphaerae bacterium]|nr:hypothetical protein [Phycisphaerae bacterium]
MKFKRGQIEILGTLDEQNRRDQSGKVGLLSVPAGSGQLRDLCVDSIDYQSTLGCRTLSNPLQNEVLLLHRMPHLWGGKANQDRLPAARTMLMDHTSFQLRSSGRKPLFWG